VGIHQRSVLEDSGSNTQTGNKAERSRLDTIHIGCRRKLLLFTALITRHLSHPWLSRS
jgi:hypothetical protein